MLNNKLKKYLTLIIILLGFFYSCFLGYNYINKYDVLKNVDGQIQNTYFFEKEGGTPSYWHEAYKIKKERENNLKNFISSGNKYEFEYLPSRLVYFYYALVGQKIKKKIANTNEEVFITNNYKFGLILIQNLFYLICLIYFYISLRVYFPNISIITLSSIFLFLSFEPTLNQWNRVLYSETIFFGLQILAISFLLSYNYKTPLKNVVLFGIILSLMYLQRSVSIYYFLIAFLYFYIFFKKKFIFNAIIIGLFYLSSHLFVGFQNLNRDGKIYFLPILAKEDLYGYFVPKILKYSENEMYVKSFQTRHDKINNFVKENNLVSEEFIDIDARQRIANNNFAESIEIIFKHPIGSLKEYLVSLTHYFLLKPNEIHFLQENNTTYNGHFYNSDKFKNEFIFKVIYSLCIYVISLIGLYYIFKKKKFKILFLLISSILYFSLPVAWHKQSSYLAPVLIYIAVFFGVGLNNLINYINKVKNVR